SLNLYRTCHAHILPAVAAARSQNVRNPARGPSAMKNRSAVLLVRTTTLCATSTFVGYKGGYKGRYQGGYKCQGIQRSTHFIKLITSQFRAPGIVGCIERNYPKMNQSPKQSADVALHRSNKDRFGERINCVGECQKTGAVTDGMRPYQFRLKVAADSSHSY